MISYLAALLAAVTNATSNSLNRKAAREAPGLADPLVATTWGVFVFGEPVRTGPVLALLVLPAAALTTGAAALIRSPRLPALQADVAGPGSGPAAGRQERGGGPVKAAGRR